MGLSVITRLALWNGRAIVGMGSPQPGIVSGTQLRRWVGRHGAYLREAEKAEVGKLEQLPNLEGLQHNCIHPKRYVAQQPGQKN